MALSGHDADIDARDMFLLRRSIDELIDLPAIQSLGIACRGTSLAQRFFLALARTLFSNACDWIKVSIVWKGFSATWRAKQRTSVTASTMMEAE